MKNKFPIMFGIFFLLALISIMPFSDAQYDWASYGNGWTPLWQSQYSSAYGKFDVGITNVTSLEGYNPSSNVQPIVSSMSSNNTAFGEKEYIIFPHDNYLQIYDKNLLLIDEINVGGTIVNQFDIADFDGDGLSNDVVGIWNISGSYRFRAYAYNFTTTTYHLLDEVNLSANSDNQILGIRCSGSDCYYLNVYPYVNTYHANFTIINRTGIYETPLTLSGSDFNVTNESSEYKSPLSWFDYDKDTDMEWLAWTNKFIVMFDGTGAVEFNMTGSDIQDVKPFISQGGALTSCYVWFICLTEPSSSFWRIAVLSDADVTAYKLDGDVLWSRTGIVDKSPATDYRCGSYSDYVFTSKGNLAIEDDYDKDYSKYDNDIYVYESSHKFNNYLYKDYFWQSCIYQSSSTVDINSYIILKGYNGNTLVSTTGAKTNIDSTLTIADMNHNGYKDFIYPPNIYDPFASSIIKNIPVSSPNFCVPADVNLDGFLEIVCSGSSGSVIYSSTAINNNPAFTSVIYNPSTFVQVNSSLVVTAVVSDGEGDIPLYYSIDCNGIGNWTIDQTSPIFSCYYDTVGIFTSNVRVHDQWHDTYNYFPQDIHVLVSITVCNLNGICEYNLGETGYSCPADCPCNYNGICESNLGENSVTCYNDCQGVSTSSAQEITLPTKIVDVDNINQGLLPEIYYGILGFFSETLSPLIILIFAIFFVLIMFSLAFIIKNIAKKVGELSR